MAYRTSAAAVKLIIETDDTISTDLVPFIEVANQLVTDCCSSAGYAATKLELIERWLSAHFYAIRDPRTTSEAVGPVKVNYQSKVDLKLDVTHYGQMAMIIDTEGGLAALNERTKKGRSKNISISWLGEDYDSEDEE